MGNCFPNPPSSFPGSTSFTDCSKEDFQETASVGELKEFSLAELKKATKNFSPGSMLGEGGFGMVYKGWVDHKTLAPSKIGVGLAIAVKKSYSDGSQGLKQWQSEVQFLGKFRHPNLVKLLGCCSEDNEYLLVYEYMPKGSLDTHLFRNGAEALSWNTRLKIAIGAARGLAFLHTTEKKVIFRDFKSSNILLDRDYNAKLSDFGLAKLGPINGESHISTGAIGTFGYAAPEYIATGHLYVKSDVYGFGVVLLELLTGQRVLDATRPVGQNNLVEWTRPYLCHPSKIDTIMDPRLEHEYPRRGAIQISTLINKCLETNPSTRPSMSQVLEILEEVSAVKMTTKELKAASRRRRSIG